MSVNSVLLYGLEDSMMAPYEETVSHAMGGA